MLDNDNIEYKLRVKIFLQNQKIKFKNLVRITNLGITPIEIKQKKSLLKLHKQVNVKKKTNIWKKQRNTKKKSKKIERQTKTNKTENKLLKSIIYVVLLIK